MYLICDAHLDLAINAVFFDRDLTLPLEEMRNAEKHLTDHKARGKGVVTFPEMRVGGVALCMASLLARSNGGSRPETGFARTDFDYATDQGSYGAAWAQLAYYRLLEKRGEVTLIADGKELDEHWKLWTGAERAGKDRNELPVGIVVSMEGSDPIVTPEDAEEWWNEGLRVVSLVHYGTNRYADGTGREGPLKEPGIELLGEFERLGMILDVTHLSDRGFHEALERYGGPVIATHNNCRELVPGQRQYTDDQIRAVAERGGLVCVALDAWMLHPDWVKGKTSPEVLKMGSVADQIDHVCSVTGDTSHVAIGSDLDGGFGYEQTPSDCRSIADLQRIQPHLSDRGYSDEEIRHILHGNLINFLTEHLP